MIISRCWRCSLVWGFGTALVVGSAEAQIVATSTAATPDPSQTLAATTSVPSDNPQPSISTSGATPTPFSSIWSIPNVTLDLPASLSYSLLGGGRSVQLTLCKTNATDPNKPPLPYQLFIVQSLPDCFGYTGEQSCPDSESSGSLVDVSYTFHSSTNADDLPEELSNFFFCFGINTSTSIICESYSRYFDIYNPFAGSVNTSSTKTDASAVASQPQILENVMTVTQTTQVVIISGAPTSNPSTTVSPIPTSAQTSSMTTASSTSATPTIAPTSIIKSSSHGLSVGAKVGIALGVLVLAFLLLLLLALFFLRRKHAQRNDGVLPNHHSTHTDSFPHTALITEKDDASPSTTVIPIPNPNQDINLNQNQPFIHHHPNPNTYSAGPDLSSSSTAPPQTYPSTVPKRKPTANAVASTISRGLSTISRSSGPSNHHSPNIGTTSSRNFESYRDVAPTYGDERHSPQVFISAQALREEGMTAEEVARLEEEERRIDAAIAEAEGR